jgi:peroxiredoxin Q/BCP
LVKKLYEEYWKGFSVAKHRADKMKAVGSTASTRSTAHQSGRKTPRRFALGRALLIAGLLFVVVGTVVWLAAQHDTTNTAASLVGKPAPGVNMPTSTTQAAIAPSTSVASSSVPITRATSPRVPDLPVTTAKLRLASSQGHLVSLAQFHGKKLVLYFYEGSTCGSCQQELVLLENLIAHRRDAVAVAASVDPVGTSTLLAKQLKLTYPILADTNHALGDAFQDFALSGPGMSMGSVDNHAIFVIDAKGIVRWEQLATATMYVPAGDITTALDKV